MGFPVQSFSSVWLSGRISAPQISGWGDSHENVSRVEGYVNTYELSCFHKAIVKRALEVVRGPQWAGADHTSSYFPFGLDNGIVFESGNPTQDARLQKKVEKLLATARKQREINIFREGAISTITRNGLMFCIQKDLGVSVLDLASLESQKTGERIDWYEFNGFDFPSYAAAYQDKKLNSRLYEFFGAYDFSSWLKPESRA